MTTANEFRFGLETEYLLADQVTYQPFWHKDVNFQQLNEILEQISIEGIPSLEGLELEPPHRKLMPYVVEGYHLPDMNFEAIDLLPKGVEIRTPVCGSIQECLDVQRTLFKRLKDALLLKGMVPVALSHHPIKHHFQGPQNKRRHDYWLWAMEVMTTYGPDINVGVSSDLMKELNLNDFMLKINYYAAAMTAFSVASPFSEGKLWKIKGQVGKSLRTYRRSVIAPPIEVHPDERNRLEFKVFDMSPQIQDYEGFFLLFLTLLVDPDLRGRASNASRIYDQGAVAVQGWDAPEAVQRAKELLDSAEKTLPKWGFEINALSEFSTRLVQQRTPSDDLVELYQAHGMNLKPVLKHLSSLG